MSATIRDVADAAGVSTATVSRALHGDPKVRAVTAARVREAAARLRYAPSLAAARLASRKAGHVTFVVRSSDVAGLGPCLAAAAAVLRGHDLDIVLDVVDDGDLLASLERLRGRTDAVVLASHRPVSASSVLRGLGVPAVLLGHPADGLPAVFVDPIAVGELAAHHLVSLGHRRVAVMAPVDPAGGVADQIAASFAHAARQREQDLDVQRLIPSADEAEQAERITAALLSMPQPPTALFTTTEHCTIGATRAFLRHGRLPGEGMALVGTGGESLAADLGLTLVTAPLAELGAAVGSMVVGLVESTPAEPDASVALAPQLVVRTSSWRATSASYSVSA